MLLPKQRADVLRNLIRTLNVTIQLKLIRLLRRLLTQQFQHPHQLQHDLAQVILDHVRRMNTAVGRCGGFHPNPQRTEELVSLVATFKCLLNGQVDQSF